MKKEEKFFIAPASIGKRIFAFIIDILIIDLFILFPFDRLFRKLIPTATFSNQMNFFQSNPQIAARLSPILVLMSLIVVFYFTYLEYKIQQTPGKMLFGIYIAPERKITYWNYLLSNLTFIVTKLFIILWIIDFFYMVTSPKNQRLLERLNGIVQVQKYKIK
ncbi:MAG: RDD family protein [Candidatus Woesearchaeota archaeon]